MVGEDEDIIERVTKIGKNGETTIPKEIRDVLELEDGGGVVVWRMDRLTKSIDVNIVKYSD